MFKLLVIDNTLKWFLALLSVELKVICFSNSDTTETIKFLKRVQRWHHSFLEMSAPTWVAEFDDDHTE